MTKNTMSRNVVMALYNMPLLPPTDDDRVMRLVRKVNLADMQWKYGLAVRALRSVGREPEYVE